MNFTNDKLEKNNFFTSKVNKSRPSIISNVSNNSRKSNKNNSKIISLINPPINKSNGKIMVNTIHNNIDKNDILYDNLLYIEGKRIINNLTDSFQITKDGHFIINSKKILYNDKDNLLNKLFTKNKNIFFENKPKIKENNINNNLTHRNSINKKNITKKILSPNKNNSISFSKTNLVHKKSKSYNKKEEIISQILNTVKVNKENENKHKKENLYKIFNSHRTSKTFSSNSLMKN